MIEVENSLVPELVELLECSGCCVPVRPCEQVRRSPHHLGEGVVGEQDLTALFVRGASIETGMIP